MTAEVSTAEGARVIVCAGGDEVVVLMLKGPAGTGDGLSVLLTPEQARAVAAILDAAVRCTVKVGPTQT